MKISTLVILLITSNLTIAGSYIFAGEANGTDVIAHPIGYTGTGTQLNITVCIDPNSTETSILETSVRNVVNSWNNLTASSPNLIFGGANDIGAGEIDWESTLLHEAGHCIGLAHPNLGSRTGVTGTNTNYTQSTDGTDNSFAFGSGSDGIIGNSDDVRGDDVNLHWFNKGVNNPYITSPPYDSSNYSFLLADLPVGHSFVTNAELTVGGTLGFTNTEAVMQQGARLDEDQRKLTVDDVSTIRLGMSGIDLVQGTADDYTINLTYGGITAGCDINIFHHDIAGLAFCSTGGSTIPGGVGGHVRITSAQIEIDSTRSWFFNTVSSSDLIFANGFE